jgi:hypothetical protein
MALIIIALTTGLTVLTIIEKVRVLRQASTDRQADALEAIHHAVERVAVAVEMLEPR